jgi:NADPH:quinone reductase
MHSIVIGPEGAFRLEQRPEPVAGPGTAVVRVRAAGLNAADLQQARGDYPAPPGWPADVPGLEIAGEIEQAGPGVTGIVPGDRVMALAGGGGHAERITVPADDGHCPVVPQYVRSRNARREESLDVHLPDPSAPAAPWTPRPGS